MTDIVLHELFLIYKELLTEKEQEYFKLYYLMNLSLREIADKLSVTHTAVGESINNAKNKLLNYEKILKMYEKEEAIRKVKDLLPIESEAYKILGGIDV